MTLEVTNQALIAGEENEQPTPIKSFGGYLGDDIYASEIGRGKVTGAKPFVSYGKLVTAGAITDNIIHSIPGTTQPLYTGATGIQMAIKSTSNEDGAGTETGILSVEIHYIDNNGDEQSEHIDLTGTTAKNTIATDIRFVQCMHMVTFGNTNKAVGNISLTNIAETVTYSYIPALKNRCASSMRYIPNGKRLMVKSVYASSASTTADTTTEIALVTTRLENHDYLTDNILFPQMVVSAQNGSEALMLDMPLPISGNTIVGFTASSNKAATITGGFVGYIENE